MEYLQDAIDVNKEALKKTFKQLNSFLYWRLY